eukprot:2495043-Amphidinium_carterae.1
MSAFKTILADAANQQLERKSEFTIDDTLHGSSRRYPFEGDGHDLCRRLLRLTITSDGAVPQFSQVFDHLRRWITTFQQVAAKTAKNKINFSGLHKSLQVRPRRFQRCSRNPRPSSSGSQCPGS